MSESLAGRYSRLDSSDLRAIVEAPEGEYVPEAVEAARAELARRALDQESGAPAELPEVTVRPSRARTFFAIFLLLAGWMLIVPGSLILASFLLSPSWDRALWGAVMLFAGLILTYMASVIDRSFWDHFVKVYAIAGFLQAGYAALHLALGKTWSETDLRNILQGSLAIVVALAVWVWRRRRA